jgi:hypothetical protein
VAADGASGAVAVAHPATGVYCVRGDRPQWARVTSADPAAGQAVAARAYTGSTPADPPCDADTAVRVTVAGTSGLANGPFHLLMRP